MPGINMPTVIVGVIVAAVIALVIIKIIKDKKSGKGGCSCGCDGCSAGCNCHSDEKDSINGGK